MRETRLTRLARLAAAEKRSREAHQDDLSALISEVQLADSEGVGVREIARTVGKSPAHTHRWIVAGLP